MKKTDIFLGKFFFLDKKGSKIAPKWGFYDFWKNIINFCMEWSIKLQGPLVTSISWIMDRFDFLGKERKEEAKTSILDELGQACIGMPKF